ncbi:MAG TPA: hypothetical protein VM187_18980, partial [Niastella sp.]|nr:hypothetical protein [Niastella sp.]
MMENKTVLYFDGTTARPVEANLRLYEDRFAIHGGADDALLQTCLLTGTIHNRVGHTHYLYLDPKGLMYIKFDAGHPIADALLKKIAATGPQAGNRLHRQKMIVLLPLLLVLAGGLYFGIL